MENNYDDIINLPHHVSTKHPRMTISQRAAQFAPFAALTGFNDEVKETARLTNKRIDIDDGLKLILNNKLQYIKKNILNIKKVEITYFIKDKNKDGGEYITILDYIKKTDEVNKLIIMTKGTKIPIDDILEINYDSLR